MGGLKTLAPISHLLTWQIFMAMTEHFSRYYNSWIEVTTRSKEHGDCDTSVTESSNMTDFTTSKLKSRTDDDFDDSLASFAPKVSFQDAANADCSFSFR